MISVIITTYREKITLPKAIQAVLDQNLKDCEILIVGPDQDTEEITKEFSQKHSEVKYLKDKGAGKPAALNLAFHRAQGDILVLTDGDVWIEKDAIRNLLKLFETEEIGAVSGRPISINPRDNLFGYWSHFLTEAAHRIRLKKNEVGEYLDCSGYLYAIRNIIKEIPAETLVEDSLISQMIWQRGYKISYASEAKVYVKYPDNLKDWIKQKIRATGGYKQKSQILNPKSQINSPPTADPPYLKIFKNKVAEKLKIQDSKIGKMRGFWQEIKDGIKLFFTYPKNLKEFYWTILLYLARIYLWFLIFWQIKIKKKDLGQIWQRVESTK